MTRARYGDLGLYRRLARQARSSWASIAALFVVGLLATPLALLTPLPLKIAVDSVLGSHPLPRFLDALVPRAVAETPNAMLLFVAALAVLIAFLAQLQAFAQKYLSAAAGEKLVLNFRARIFRHLQRVSLSYHDSTGTADSVYRIQSDAPAIRYIVVDGFVPAVSAALTLIGMVYVTVRIDWQLALVALTIAPALLLVSRTYRPRLRTQSRDVKKLESSAMSVVHEVLGAIRIVKMFGQEDREGERFVHRSSEGVRARIRLAAAEGHFSVVVGLITATGMAGVLFIGVGHVRSGLLSLGDLLLVIGYIAKLYEPLKTISRKMATLQGYLASIERAFSLLDQLPDVAERPHGRAIARARGAVAFRHVSFSYAEDRHVLHDISFEIGPGTRLGIAGTTGAGKSTLISLLTRLYDPTTGEILLDGVDLRNYRLEDLRRQFAIVPQEPVLFATSIAENIAYAMPGASRQQIVAAAQAADAHEFIERLPQGYDTQVAERGVKLSGGQRQRIALARAFLKDSPVLILDEPTSAVDSQTEAVIVDALERLQQGRTVILISHRPTTLAGVSAVLVLEEGRLVADTTTASAAPPSALGSPSPRRLAPAARAKRVERLRAHPAVQAWRRLDPSHGVPERISPAKVKPHQRRTPVYRLDGAGPDGAAVIAKGCTATGAEIERIVYERFLPHLPLQAARYYGYVEDPVSELTWLFIDELRGEEYSYLLHEHRVCAARWLGILHRGGDAIGPQRGLPDAGPNRYLQQLRTARDLIRSHSDNPALRDDDLTFLQSLECRFDDLEEHWDRLVDSCAGMPETLVHGDFSGKNIRVQAGAQPTAVVFDWEDAGWGVPAADLAQFVQPKSRIAAGADIPTYWSIVRDHWRDHTQADIEQLACCGTVFRSVAALQWDSHHLAHEWAEWFVASMRLYDAELVHALDRLDWVRRTPSQREVIGT
jgi:ATP-binding cassette subfamily B protein